MIEPWADAELSAKLPLLCSQGEGQSLEFKRELPDQLRDLAKEVAALSSSDGGWILIGVEDDGTVRGVPNAETAAGRDDLCQRIVGICTKVEPPVRPRLAWAVTGDLIVLAISVEKGSEPIYYVDQRPYIRHSTVSRPAKPAEVAAAIASRAAANAKESDTHPELTALAELLSMVLVWCDADSEIRELSPWVEEWAAIAGLGSATLRQLAASGWANTNGHVPRLEAVAEKLTSVASFRHVTGGGYTLQDVCSQVRTAVDELMRDLVWSLPIRMDDEAAIRFGIARNARHLVSLWQRAEKEVFDGRVEMAQEEAASIGKQMAGWTYYRMSTLPETSMIELRQIGLAFFQLSAQRVYMDGGESLRTIVRQGRKLSDKLMALAANSFTIGD